MNDDLMDLVQDDCKHPQRAQTTVRSGDHLHRVCTTCGTNCATIARRNGRPDLRIIRGEIAA